MIYPIIAIVLALFVGQARAAAPDNPAPASTIYFVQLTDTHLGVMDHEVVLGQMVEAINKLPFPISFVVHTGDLVMDNYQKTNIQAAASELLGRIKAPVHVVPGNHDLSEKTTRETLAVWTNRFGALGRTVDYGGVRFAFVFTEGMFKKGPAGEFDPFAFLERTLDKAGDKPVILFQHSNWFEDYYANALHPGWSQPIRDRWTKMVTNGAVKAVVTGHCHRDEFHWEGTVPVYVGEAAARFWGRQPAFRIYCWENGRLSYRTWYLGDSK